jgi:nucleoside 2-deoxyribosyltransferase
MQKIYERRHTPGVRPEITARKLALASGAVRELTMAGVDPFVEDLDELLASVAVPQDPFEQIDRLVLYLLGRAGTAADLVYVNPHTDRSIMYAADNNEFAFLRTKAVELNYIERTGPEDHYRLSLDGWRRAKELKQERRDSTQAFVAMWFDPQMDEAFHDGIRPALEETGYRPLRIDMAEHNDKIDDRIVAEIRKSGLLVADFTGNRGGVYFEAGLALGLGLPVIWLCRKDRIGEVHFDTRQYNHIVWTTPESLRAKLRSRIEATLPIRLENMPGASRASR